MSGKLRLAIVGTQVGGNLMGNAAKQTESFEVDSCCDLNAEAAEKFAETHGCKPFTSLDDLLRARGEEIDAVHASVPSAYHPDIVIPTLNAGLHAISDKPLATSIAKMDECAAAAAKSKGRLLVVSQCRYSKGAQLLAKALTEKRFGRIHYVQVRSFWNRKNSYYAGRWQGTWGVDGGAALINQGIHPTDVATWLLSQGQDRKRSDLFSIQRATIIRNGFRKDVMEAEDFVQAMLQTTYGTEVEIVSTTSATPEMPWSIEFMGEGNVVFEQGGGFHRWEPVVQNAEDDAEATALLIDTDAPVDTSASSDPAAVGSAFHALMMDEFAHSLKTGAPCELEAQHGGDWAARLIRQIYAYANDPCKIRPADFTA